MLNNPHLVVLISVSDGTNESAVRDYSRRFFAGMRTLGDDLPADIGDLPCVKLSLFDREARLRSLSPDAVQKLMAQERCLLAEVSLVKKLPPGEKLIKSYCQVLAEKFDVCPPGTVVVIRQTDAATMGFLCPHLRVDPDTGILSKVDNPLKSERRGSSMPQSGIGHSPSALSAGDAAGTEYMQIALQTATVLSFALPPPFSFVIPGMLTFISGLLGIPQDQPQANPFRSLEERLKNDKMADWMTTAATLLQYINRQTGVMASAPPTPKEVIEDHSWMGSLDLYITPGQGSLFTYLRQVQNLDDFISNQNRFFALMTCVNVYLFGVKWKLYLKAWVASEYKKQNDAVNFLEYNRQWRSDYAGWVEDIVGGPNYAGWASRVNKLIDDRIAYRLGQITGVGSYNHDEWPATEHGGIPIVHHHHYSYWKDPGDQGERQYDDEMDKNDHLKVSHYQDAVTARNAHYAAVEKSQHEFYSKTRELTKAWIDSINQWNSHLPPGKPLSAPSVDPKSWQHPVPADSLWSKHKDDSVSYAVEFYNQPEHGDELHKAPKPGPIGEWSDPVDIKGGYQPGLVNVPVDAIKLATGRHIYRKFISADGAPSEVKLVGLIPDNATTTYKDV